MKDFKISVTGDYERLVPFFIENELEFSEDEPVPTDLVKCWNIMDDEGEDGERIIGAFVLAKREGEFIVDGIAIDPKYRKYHLGKALLEKGIEETKKAGRKTHISCGESSRILQKARVCNCSERRCSKLF